MSMTTGKKVLLGCGIAAVAVVGCVILMIGGCVGMLAKGFMNFPAYAKAEVANPANKDVTDRINAIIVESNSLGQAQQKIAAEPWPAKVLYIGFELEKSAATSPSSTEYKDAYKRTTWSGSSSTRMNGNGYGSLDTPSGKKDIVILDRTQDTGNGLSLKYTVYIEHLP